jgi:hypothetical protein
LSLDIAGNGSNLAGQFRRDDFTAGYSAPVKLLKSLVLAGFEAACFAVYLLDGRYPLYDSNTHH